MRNKFLKMTFMALCLSISSALHAMNEDEARASHYVGKYEIRRNDPYEQSSGNVMIRQEGDLLVLEDFTLIPGSYYHNHIGEVITDTKENAPFETEQLRVANFVLSALPTEVLKLKYLRDAKGVQYLGVTNFGELHKMWTSIKDRTPSMWVRFYSEKSSYFGEMFTLFVESPFSASTAAPLEEFRLFKVGSAEHERLLRPLFAPAVRATPAVEPTSTSVSSSSSPMHPVKTFRTTGTNPNAMNKHSAISIQLPNQQLQDDMYTLVINHRTSAKGSQVRTYAPKDGKLNVLGDLPLSATFSDTSFNITPWVQSIREEGSLMTNIAAYLTFADGQSDIHSFTIQPKGSSLMTVILGDKDSEAQSGIHVYAPETDGDTNDWSKSRSDE